MGNQLTYNIRKCRICNEVLPICPCWYYHSFNLHQIHEDKCEKCSHKLIRDEEERQRDEERRREEERQRREEEEQKIKEEEKKAREAEEKKREEELSQRLQESQQRAKEQHEKQLTRNFLEEKTKRDVLIRHLNEFEANDESGSDRDELLEILSMKCSFSVLDLSLSELTADKLEKILSVLDKLVFVEWVSGPPSISTLQHTQVFLTELCVLSLDISDGSSLQSISNHLQSLVESISNSASSVSESFLLTQALYLNLMHFLGDHSSSDSDATVIAKQWAAEELSTEQLFLIDFLSVLTSSLQTAVEKVSVYILKMEIQCMRLLLSTLTHLNEEKTHSEPTEMLLRLVQTNRWTPTEALTLLKALTQKYAEDVSITEVLTLVQVNDISPEWTDESGRSLIQGLDFACPEKFHQVFQKALRRKDETTLVAALAEFKMLWNLDDSVIEMIKNITTGVLQHKEKAPEDEPFMKDSFKCATLNADNLQKCLSQLCKAVFDTRGRWPTVRQMLRWCVLVLNEKSGAPQLVGVEEDSFVTAMFAATQVCRGHKLDVVLNFDGHSEEPTKEWSDFYKYLGISVNTNMNKSDASFSDVYEADVVYGTFTDFICDYLRYSMEVMETGELQHRGFIVEEQRSSHNLEFSMLKDYDSLVFAAEVLQNLMGKYQSEYPELRNRFIKALFQVLHTHLNKDTNADNIIITIVEKLTGKGLPSNEVFVLTFLEKILHMETEETESERNWTSPAGRCCLEILFACAERLQASATTKELSQKISNLGAQRLWSPVEALHLLGKLTDHHHDEGCISIMKILYLLETYQVSSTWTDENYCSLLNLLDSNPTEILIQHLAKSLRDEKGKSIDAIFDEIRQMEDIDERTLRKSQDVVTHVTQLITTGEIKNYTNVTRARSLSHSTDTEDLREVLAVLCNAVHLHKAAGKWWPRATQMIGWCLLALSHTGKLLEMGTGEGKSCVIAMFAVLRALRGEKVDVVSSSSVLCQRDAEEWTNFYKYFRLMVDTNTDKTEDNDRKRCYQKDVVYGTIEAFAADHLRQIFEMKDIRPDRGYQCIIIDEVDSLLLDQGVQLTYLSSPMASMQHLNVILAMIWVHVSQYGLLSTGHQTFVQGPPSSFFKAIFDSIDTDDTEINEPMDILYLAEECRTVPEGFTEDFYRSEKDELLSKLKTVRLDDVVIFFKQIEDYVPYGFTVYTLDDNGLLCLKKQSPNKKQDIQELTFLVLEEGLCCPLYDSEDSLIKSIAELISEKIQYTPCENNEDKVSVPGFLKNLVEKKVSVWVQNAFLAKQLNLGQEYILENDQVCPVDFRSTGIVELNKKWGDGLQQFVEIKHQIKLSTISIVTNYVSNISFFEKYKGKIYGTTGTLGSTADILFLQDLYPYLSACKIPTFNRKKLFEVKGTLKTSTEEWKSEIKHEVIAQISPNSYRGGRAALVICESINKAEEVRDKLKSSIPGEIILYSRSDQHSLSRMGKELLPGDVIVATNLAGRGTDIKVSKQVNDNGGLFVILSFLSENTRVELQAFGRTARKGKPGSAQVIVSTAHLQQSVRTSSSLEEARSTRDKHAAEKIHHIMTDVTELRLREDLFSEYCNTLQDIHQNKDGDEKKAVVATMNEFWGIWLQTKSEEIEQLKRNELQKSLKEDLSWAKSQSLSQTSPCSSIYHYIKFGNVALSEERWDDSIRLFEKAMKQDESWAAIAFYNHAYCILKQKNADYFTRAKDDLKKAEESLKILTEEASVCLNFVKMSSVNSANSDTTSLQKQLENKLAMLDYFDKNITEALQKLDEIKEKGEDAITNIASIFSLGSNSDEGLQDEAYNLYNQGLEFVFSVKEKFRFSWKGLLVFCIGASQIIGGTFLTAVTFGTLAQIGMGLINEGISDCINGIRSMITGEFSWKSWAIGKAISVGVSLIAFGVGKLIAKGFKACKTSVKTFGKQLKSMPKFLSNQTKEGLSSVAKTTMKNAGKHTVKIIVEEVVNYGLGKVEEKLLTEILHSIKKGMKEKISDKVKANLDAEPLASLVNSIICAHVEDEKQLQDLLNNRKRKRELLDIFRYLSKTSLQPFLADLGWRNQLSSSIFQVINTAATGTDGTTWKILTVIQTVHMGFLVGEASFVVYNLSDKFFTNLHKELKEFNKERGFTEKKANLHVQDNEMLREFKQDLADTISALLSDALVEVFHQKVSSHVVSFVQGQVNGLIRGYVRKGLNTIRTEEKLKAGQNNRYIAHMQLASKSKHKFEAGQRSQSHAERIRDATTAGTLLDIRVLSEATGTKVVILTKNGNGKLSRMQKLSPSTKPASQTVTLIYEPSSTDYPGGHYEVLINDQRVPIVSGDKSCLFHALARGIKPAASEGEIALEAQRLRSVEADALHKHPGQWEPFIKRKEWTEKIRGGDWFMLEGAASRNIKKKLKENKEVLEKETGKVGTYKDMKKYTSQNQGMGDFIHADHQPPVQSILEALILNPEGTLAKAMMEVATNSSPLDPGLIDNVCKNHGLELPAVYVSKELHGEFLSTRSKAYRNAVAKTISNDDVEGTLKLMILGSMPRFWLDNNKNFKDFQSSKSQTRLSVFEKSFPVHSKKVAQKWFGLLQNKGVMTNKHLDNINVWIDNKCYNNPNDSYRNQVCRFL